MAVVTKTVLKSYFETGDIPTQAQFIDLIDTLVALIESNISDNDWLIKNTTGNYDISKSSAGGFNELRMRLDTIAQNAQYTLYDGGASMLYGQSEIFVGDTIINVSIGFTSFYRFEKTISVNKFHFNLPNFADDAAAGAAGLTTGMLWRDPLGFVRSKL